MVDFECHFLYWTAFLSVTSLINLLVMCSIMGMTVVLSKLLFAVTDCANNLIVIRFMLRFDVLLFFH